MKTLKVVASEVETSAELDLFSGRTLTKDQKREIQKEVGDYLVEQTLATVATQKSPISGESWPKLKSKEYKKLKLAEVGNTNADMEFSGKTLDELDWKPTDKGIKIGVFGARAPIADGHSNLSGKSKLPQRRSIPDKGQSYLDHIETEVHRIVADVVASGSDPRLEKLTQVKNKTQLYNYLTEYFGAGLSRPELKLAVFRNKEIFDLLDGLGMIALL